MAIIVTNRARVDKPHLGTQSEYVTVDQKGAGLPAVTQLIARAPRLLSGFSWVWPLVGALLISVMGAWVRGRAEGTIKAEFGSHLQTVLNADVAALRLWFSEKEHDAKSFASDVRIQATIAELAALAIDTNLPPNELISAGPAKALSQLLESPLAAQNYLDYVVIGPDKRILASPRRSLVGRVAPPVYDLFVERALAGQLAVSRPFTWPGPGRQRIEGPSMFVAAPVVSSNGVIQAVLGLRMKPEGEFSRIFSVARIGQTGETYAFDRRGVMLTDSRFNRELKMLGLIGKTADASPILNLRLLDPGVDLTRGEHPNKPRSQRELTRMATAAVKGQDGCDVDGYRNYRGVTVIGAWAWLPEYGMGVATEVAKQEAFRTLYVLRRMVLILFLLLLLSSMAIFIFTVLVERLQASVRRNALAARRLGQYVLVEQIGRGADGMVYRARHTLLRRPVAIKLLSPELTDEDSAARFEHEVQMTSQLTHPNTVAIFDYGRTPEGLFYYAMEYLGGIDLNCLVRQFGPQPEGRVIHILRQVCGALAEAHGIGLIHRDVKPANIVLTCRGGICDVVKVLDFGLVKAIQPDLLHGAKSAPVVGTPHFMAPETIAQPGRVDARSDLYSLGAVGYWLLTGETLFKHQDVDGLLDQQLSGEPVPPSQRLGRAVSADLEDLLMQCLAKGPEKRPVSAEALEAAVAACEAAAAWGPLEAQAWWRANLAALETNQKPAMTEKTLVIAPRNS